ncbi:MAG: TM0106 family RecB-like putative nuclease [Patescibacteria group bacterium]
MSKPHDTLTGTDFFRFYQCPHWPYWERWGDPNLRRPLTEAEEQRLADGLTHEQNIVAKTYGAFDMVKTKNPTEAAAQTLGLMKQGVPVIYQACLKDGEWVGRPDLLERRPGKSALGDWYYVPVDVKRAHELKKEHMAQLTFYAVLLERAQGMFPPDPAILNADGERIPFRASSFLSEFHEIVEQIERMRDGECPDPVFRKSCLDISPWGAACEHLAKSTNDIALLYNVDVRKLKALRSFGIRTIEDAANLDPLALEGQAPGLTIRALEAVQRQARSVMTESVFIRAPFFDEVRGLEIHFDIESHPPTDADYLYGFWIPSEQKYLSFVAESPEEEGEMWQEFLAWIETLPSEYTIYHYAPYEVQRLRQLSRRYHTEENPWLAKFMLNMIDIKDIVSDHLVFPLPFYSLKAIGRFLGFAWEGEVHSGGESVLAFDKWMEKGDRTILDSIIQYNREDVRATAHLIEWIRKYAKVEATFVPPYPWQGQA